MGDHTLEEPEPDVSRTVEVKVVVATAVTLGAGVTYAVLDAVQADPSVLEVLPPWLRFVVLAALPPVLAFLAGYRMPSNRVS